MTRWRLVLAGLRHHWRAHLLLSVGFALAAAVLTGALLVGDSVRATLGRQALARIGRIDAVLVAGDRTFRAALASELEEELGVRAAAPESMRPTLAPALALPGVASASGGARRASEVTVLGVDARFLALAPEPRSGPPPGRGELFLNERLARQLEARVGDEVLLRVLRPSALSRDMVLATVEDDTAALRGRVAAVLGERELGRFGLEASALPPHAAWVALAELEERVGLEGRANLIALAAGGDAARVARRAGGALARRANEALARRFTLDDLALEIGLRGDPPAAELTSARVFLDAPVAEALDALELPLVGVLTYFVNEIASGERVTPYSTVAALGPLGSSGAEPFGLRALVPSGLGPREIVAGEWLAEDLALAPGGELELRYYEPGPDRRLSQASRSFRVRAVAPPAGLAADPALMPEFPGIADSAHCRDWTPGVPIELDAIRPKDEQYWEERRGTPKAFLSLAAGRELWASRFGSLTAARAPAERAADLARELRAALDPADFGLFFRDARTPALAAGRSATDFGGLFLALSSFLVAAALLFAALLLVLGVEARARETGTLLALGFRPREVRRLFFAEAGIVALAAAAAGALLGVAYTGAVLRALATIWRDAVAGTAIELAVRAPTPAVGAGATLLVSLAAARLALRGQARRSAVELLATSEGVSAARERERPRRSHGPLARGPLAIALVCIVLAVLLVAIAGRDDRAAAAFFGAGTAVLAAALALARAAIALAGRGAAPPRSVTALGLRNAARRPGRSLATVALLATGTFLVLSVGAHRRSAHASPEERSSGTGGFALFARSTLPLHEDLATERGLDAYGLDPKDLAGAAFVPLRVRAGDDASCLNLGSPERPRLLGVDPRELARRGAFTFVAHERARPKERRAPPVAPGERDGAHSAPPAREAVEDSPWMLLERELGGGAVPAIGDASSVRWALKRRLGDELDYVDDRGRPFRVRIVATLEDSVLQGALVIAERAFRERFPSESGHGALLIDAPPERAAELSALLSRALASSGLELVPTARRLAELYAVQNTYLDVFQVLGGLGLLLGCLGLSVVVLRNALERRRELALLRAVGFGRASLARLLFAEHALLVALALCAGTLAASVALLPAVRSAASSAPLGNALPLVLLLLAAALAALLIAAQRAVRAPLLEALRRE